MCWIICNYILEKKVLLLERKRHTICRVASARYADLFPDGRGGGAPSCPGWERGYPSSPGWGYHPVYDRGVPPVLILDGVSPWQQDRLTPHQQNGVPPCRPIMGYPSISAEWGIPVSRMGTLHPDLGWGTSRQQDRVPPLDLGWGAPTPIQTWDGVPLHKCEQTENITFPHPSDAGSKNLTKMIAQFSDGCSNCRIKILLILKSRIV